MWSKYLHETNSAHSIHPNPHANCEGVLIPMSALIASLPIHMKHACHTSDYGMDHTSVHQWVEHAVATW